MAASSGWTLYETGDSEVFFETFQTNQNPCLDLSEIKFRKRAVGLTSLSGWWLVGHRADSSPGVVGTGRAPEPRDVPALCSESEGFITVPCFRAFRGFSGLRF